jgi:hypothetical protein
MSESKEYKNAQLLREAFQGHGTDEAGIIQVLGSLLNEDVTPLVRIYHETFSRDLHHDLKSELSGDFEKLCLALVTQVDEFDADCLRDAFQGMGTNEALVIEVLCNRTDEEIQAISAAYNRKYNQELRARVHSELGGKFRTLIETVLAGRQSSGDVPALVEELYRAGEGKFGTDEKAFIRILGGYSPEVLQDVSQAYKKAHGKDLVRVVKSELGGDFQKAAMALVTPDAEFYAQLFKQKCRGVTNEKACIRILRANKEKHLVEMSSILEADSKPLMTWCSDEFSSLLKRLAVALCANFAGRESL